MLEIVGTFLGIKHWDKRADCAVEGPNSPRGNLAQERLEFAVRQLERQRADVARARRRWMRAQGLFDPARLVFIDETAVSTNMVRLCCVGAASARSAVVCPRDAAARARTPARRSLRGNGHRVQVYQLEMKARLSVPDLWWCPVARSVEAHDFLRRGRF